MNPAYTISLYSYNGDATPGPVENVKTLLYKGRAVSGYYLDLGYTDSEGVITFSSVLSGQVYTVLRFHDNYYYDPEVIDVTDTDISFVQFGRAFNKPSDPVREYCMVYGFARDIIDIATDNVTLSVAMWSATAVFTEDGEQVLAYPVDVPIDDDGYWEVPLVPSFGLVPAGSKYLFTFSWRESNANPHVFKYQRRVIVPTQASADFGDLQGY